MVRLYIWLLIYTNNEILCIIWKFDLSSWGVLGRIYALSIKVLLDLASTGIILSRQRTTKALIRLRGFAGWSAPLLFAYGKSRFSHDVALIIIEPEHDIINKRIYSPSEKTQISLGICPAWSEYSLSAWRKFGSLATHKEHSEYSKQIDRMPMLIYVLAGRTAHCLLTVYFKSSITKPPVEFSECFN